MKENNILDEILCDFAQILQKRRKKIQMLLLSLVLKVKIKLEDIYVEVITSGLLAEKCSTFCIRVVLHPNWCSLVQHLLVPIKKRVHNGAVNCHVVSSTRILRRYWLLYPTLYLYKIVFHCKGAFGAILKRF